MKFISFFAPRFAFHVSRFTPSLLFCALAVFAAVLPAPAALQIVSLTTPQPWQRAEFRITGVPTVSNPFDPDLIRVDATFALPSGKTVSIPAFWYQDYQRKLSGGSEVLSTVGSGEWRLRFAPSEIGVCSITVSVVTNGLPCGSPTTTNFTVSGSVPVRSGYVRLNAGKQYFETGDGQRLPLLGENVCWHGSAGTYDYDTWFSSMQAASENYARIWMCPWAFGLETDATSLNHYRLDRAWQLDYTLQLAELRGIYLELCLDYHGMFAVEPDYWGGNNYWPSNPYCITNGGPCINQDAFFTNATAQGTYQKRLRYLVARYGYSPNLLAWQFFNEIDNVYSLLNATNVASWHAAMGNWMRTNDPFGHLLTTSFTYAQSRPEMWVLPQMDYVCVHSYGATRPANSFSAIAQSMRQAYGKPVLLDEFGTSWQGWNRSADPYLRGFRQSLWGGALGGSAGTAMSWWWQNIQSENVYPAFAGLGAILNRTGWGRGSWTNLTFSVSLTPPVTVGDLVTNGQPFTVTLPLSSSWGAMLSGQLAVPNAGAANYSADALNSFVHGSAHADLKIPFRLSAWFTNSARIVMHINSVSWNSSLAVRSDGIQLYRTNLPNVDGAYSVTNEYNLDLAVALPAGRHLVEVVNLGGDWFYLDWVRLEQVLPAAYTNGWQPPCEPIGLSGQREALLYVVAPGAAFSGSSTNTALPLQQGQTVTLTNWPAGDYFAEWYDPSNAQHIVTSRATVINGTLTLPLPGFREDLAGILYPPPRLTPINWTPAGAFQLQLDSETGGRYWIETSTNLVQWVSFGRYTNTTGTTVLTDPGTTPARKLYRARQ